MLLPDMPDIILINVRKKSLKCRKLSSREYIRLTDFLPVKIGRMKKD